LTKPCGCKTGWKITLLGSCFTSGAEYRYALVEGKAFEVVEELDKARHFSLLVAVDHKPLLSILGNRCINNIPNPCLRKLKKKSLRY